MSATPFTREQKIAVRRGLLEDLDRKVKKLGRLPSQKEVEDDPEMKSIGGYTQIFHGIRNAWDVWIMLQAGILTDDDLAEPIRKYSSVDPGAYDISGPLKDYAEALNSTLDTLDAQFSRLEAGQYKVEVQDAAVIYMGRVYYRNHENARIIVRMTEILQRALNRYAGGEERKSLVAWARDCGYAMKHPGTYYPFDPD